jgi:hypothetical protein
MLNMPEFHFYCTRAECSELLNAVLIENHIQCAIDKWYDAPFCETHSTASNDLVDEIFAAKRRVFLLCCFTTDGICFNSHDSGPMAGRYSIDVTRKGPLLTFSLPAWFEEGGFRRIGCGTLHHQPKYYDEDLNHSLDPSAELMAGYNTIQDTLRSRLKHTILMVPVWISSSVLQLVDQRRATVKINGKWVGGPLNSISISPRYPRPSQKT